MSFHQVLKKAGRAIYTNSTNRGNNMKAGVMVVMLSAMALTLSSCSGMFTNEARCPFKDKGGCQSVSDVNRMIDEGRYTDDGRFVQQAGVGQGQVTSMENNNFSAENIQPAIAATGGWNSPTPYAGEPLRTPEVDARMWVSPWLDTQNAYHGASYINFVVTPSHWQALGAKAIRTHSYEREG